MAKYLHRPSGYKTEELSGDWVQVFDYTGKRIAKALGMREARGAIWIYFYKRKEGTFVHEKDFIEIK